MRNRIRLFHLATVTVLGSLIFASANAIGQSMEPLVTGNTSFAFDLYSRLKGADGNIFFSPYSISTCLGMTYTGARGETASQMATVLHFDTDVNSLSASFAALQNELKKSQRDGIEFNLANGLWAEKTHFFLKDFLKNAEASFSARLSQADFVTQADPVRREINDWVSRQTKGKITDLLQPGVVDARTRLVLVNAIYFKGKWLNQFQKSLTQDAPFHVTPAQDVQAPLMHVEKLFNYAETEDLQLLELPYLGGGLAMVVLLPKDVGGLSRMEEALTGPALNKILSQASRREVSVFLPKFKMTSQFSLAQTLAGMGMKAPFSSGADFSGMDGSRDLYISAVIHKAYVDLDEEGTEAAAATATTVRSLAVMAPRPKPVFRADHPFVFLIRDTQSGAILFLGRMSNPTK